jgi:large subunit ribosomal protein L1
MGKKRIITVGEETEKRKIVKSGKQHGRISDMGMVALEEYEKKLSDRKEEPLKAQKETEDTEISVPPKTSVPSVIKKVKKEGPARQRSQKYLQVGKDLDKNKFYPPSEAVKVLKKISISRFNGNVDIHLNVKEVGLKGEVEFPYPTGKTQVVRIADEQLIKDLEKGKIDFTLLLATPKMMPKLVKFAKLLGPRGLMPNPKSGTISDQPEELAKKIVQKTQFRTETKSPLIHLSLGKVNDPEKNLEENFKVLIKAVGKRNIKKAVLAPTMGPGVKIDLSSV